MFGIRNTATGEVIRTYENPIEAKKAVLLTRPEGYADFEVVEKTGEEWRTYPI
jgi:hypothetical protein